MFIIRHGAGALLERRLDEIIDELDALIADPEHQGRAELITRIRLLNQELANRTDKMKPPAKSYEGRQH